MYNKKYIDKIQSIAIVLTMIP